MKHLLAFVLSCVLAGQICISEAAPFELDRTELDTIEDLAESLANDLLDLSVALRERNESKIATFLAAQMEATPFPEETGERKEQAEGIIATEWQIGDVSRSLSGEAFLSSWTRFLARFERIEDARLKVKQAEFTETTHGQARVFFFMVGRNREGHREWVRGYASVEAEHQSAESRWQIVRFQLQELHTLVAEQDLFSEVSLSAGTALTLPGFGTEGNEGFAWHGAAVADLDLDGNLDIFATSFNRNYLYLNEGNGRFREVASEMKLAYVPVGVAPLFLDYDNDGDSDLFISAVGDQLLFENRQIPDGALEFVDVSISSGVAQRMVGFSAVAGDVNQDGWPDIYVCAYNYYGQVMPNAWHQATNGTPNRLFVNQRDGTFREMAEALGVADSRWSYAAQFVDFDEDGDQDLYVANDYGENALYLNEGGHFHDVAEERGVLDPGNGMGVSFGDYDNDGDLDLHVTNMSSTAGNRILKRLFPASDPRASMLAKLASGNSLYENLGDGMFRNVTQAVGGFSSGWAWGGGFIDFNNDGWEDFYTPDGFLSGKSMKDT